MRLGSHMTDEQRTKDSMAHMGKTASPETRAKMSVAHSNYSPEMRASISLALMGNKNSLGYHHPEESQARISASHWRGGRLVCNRRHHAKRRGLGRVCLNSPFIGCEGHHVDNEFVINMPRELHQGKGNGHNHETGRGMARMNAIAYNFLFKQEVEAALEALR